MSAVGRLRVKGCGERGARKDAPPEVRGASCVVGCGLPCVAGAD